MNLTGPCKQPGNHVQIVGSGKPSLNGAVTVIKSGRAIWLLGRHPVGVMAGLGHGDGMDNGKPPHPAPYTQGEGSTGRLTENRHQS